VGERLLPCGGVGEELELHRFGHRDLDSAGWAWLGDNGESVVLQASLSKTLADIRRFSVKDAVTYADLTEAGIKILKIQDEYGLSQPKRPSLATVPLPCAPWPAADASGACWDRC